MNKIVVKDSDKVIEIPQHDINQKDIEQKTAFFREQTKTNNTTELIPYIDLTNLNETDTKDDIKKLVNKALSLKHKNLPSVASICIYPSMLKFAKERLDGNSTCSENSARSGYSTGRSSKINVETPLVIATVTGGFPSGKLNLESKLIETKEAIQMGADEIDFTICRDYCKPSEAQKLFDEIYNIKKLVGRRPLKVILETEELHSYDKIKLASNIALYAGADFIKTSTGKIKGPLDHKIASFLVIMDSILDFYNQTKKQVGIKVSGGISGVDTAMLFFNMVQTQMGEKWVSPKFFRIGSSKLMDNIV